MVIYWLFIIKHQFIMHCTNEMYTIIVIRALIIEFTHYLTKFQHGIKLRLRSLWKQLDTQNFTVFVGLLQPTTLHYVTFHDIPKTLCCRYTIVYLNIARSQHLWHTYII